MYSSSPVDLLRRARQGDRDARERLLEKYQPFVISIVAKTCGRYVSAKQDDEANIGLLAFNEAIDCFKTEKSQGENAESDDTPEYWANSFNRFLMFSESVIRRRLIDYFRVKGKFKYEVSSGSPGTCAVSTAHPDAKDVFLSHEAWPGEHQQATTAYEIGQRSMEQRDEILRFSRVLIEYGTSLKELEEASPKHIDTRNWLLNAAKMIAADEILAGAFRSDKELPLREAARRLKIPVRRIRRHRKYLTALVVIFTGNFPV